MTMLRVVAAASLVFSACAKTNQQAIDELKPRYAELRQKLTALAPLAAGETQEGSVKGLVYDEVNSSASTVTVLAAEQIADPDFELSRGNENYTKRFDPIAGGSFLNCVRWTGPKNPMSESALPVRHGEDLKKECLAAADQTRFVVIVDTLRSVVPTLVSDGEFSGGAADLRVTIIEFPSRQVLSRFEVQGKPDQVIKYQLRPGESKAVEAAIAVHGSMWVDARQKIFDGLKQRGAVVNLR